MGNSNNIFIGGVMFIVGAITSGIAFNIVRKSEERTVETFYRDELMKMYTLSDIQQEALKAYMEKYSENKTEEN